MWRLLYILIFSLFWSITCAESEKVPGADKKAETQAADTTGQVKQAEKDAKSDSTVLELEKDSLGNLMVFDYSIKLKAFSHINMKLEDMKDKNFLLFYFSARCGHCKQSIPYLLKLVKEMENDSLYMIAIALGHNKDEDIATFIKTLKVDVPMFQDSKKEFSKKYGTGFVPVVYLVTKKGTYFHLRNFKKEKSPEQIKKLYRDKSIF
jgi:thiol-disulfide isomerase/thioredoxin